jgi:hypothetical protein
MIGEAQNEMMGMGAGVSALNTKWGVDEGDWPVMAGSFLRWEPTGIGLKQQHTDPGDSEMFSQQWGNDMAKLWIRCR